MNVQGADGLVLVAGSSCGARLSSVAYMILNELRRIALAGTELAHAQVSTIRTRLLKIGAIVTTSVRRIYVALRSRLGKLA